MIPRARNQCPYTRIHKSVPNPISSPLYFPNSAENLEEFGTAATTRPAGRLFATAVSDWAFLARTRFRVIIFTLCLTICGIASFNNEGELSKASSLALTGTLGRRWQISCGHGGGEGGVQGVFFFGGLFAACGLGVLNEWLLYVLSL